MTISSFTVMTLNRLVLISWAHAACTPAETRTARAPHFNLSRRESMDFPLDAGCATAFASSRWARWTRCGLDRTLHWSRRAGFKFNVLRQAAAIAGRDPSAMADRAKDQPTVA